MNAAFFTRPLACLLSIMTLSGCVFFFEPHASSRWEVPAGTSAEEVFICARKTVQSLSSGNGRWPADVTRLDTKEGVLDIGDYLHTDSAGFKVLVTYAAEDHEVQVNLRGGGPYNLDLGVDAGMARIRRGMEVCLSRPSH